VSTDTLEKVLDRLAVTDKATLVLERAPEGKMRVTSGSWDGKRCFCAIRCSRLVMSRGEYNVAREPRRHDEWDPPIPVYDPYGPDDEFIDD
jgi:hypothetical protein